MWLGGRSSEGAASGAPTKATDAERDSWVEDSSAIDLESWLGARSPDAGRDAGGTLVDGFVVEEIADYCGYICVLAVYCVVHFLHFGVGDFVG
jgi:hypothetical protein